MKQRVTSTETARRKSPRRTAVAWVFALAGIAAAALFYVKVAKEHALTGEAIDYASLGELAAKQGDSETAFEYFTLKRKMETSP